MQIVKEKSPWGHCSLSTVPLYSAREVILAYPFLYKQNTPYVTFNIISDSIQYI